MADRICCFATLSRWAGHQLKRPGLLLFVLLAGACHSERPSDETLIRHFEENAGHFAAIITMLGQDPKVGTIGRDFLFEADKPFVSASVTRLGITEERLDEYKRILARAGVSRLDRYGEAVSFGIWGSGFAGNTHHKGIAWLANEPQGGSDRRFSHIRDNWYLYDD